MLDAVSSVVSQQDYNQIKRILTEGCPHTFKFEEPVDNKARALVRGNQKSFSMNDIVVNKTINKEDRNSHIVPMHGWVCELAPNFRHTPQGLVLKTGSNPRAVWDGSTQPTPADVVMNKVTPTEHEADITVVSQSCYFISTCTI